MTAGRKPKPTNLKLIQGTYRPDRANPSEPKPRAVIPPCPKFLQGEAKKQYQKTAKKLKSRYDSYAIGRNNGWLSANDIRRLENMNPLPPAQGDVYLIPLNMIPAGSASPEPVNEPAAGKVVE